MKKGYIYSIQNTLFGSRDVIGFSNGKLYVKEIDRHLANKIIEENHYSHKFYNNSYIHLGVWIDNVMVGVLQYGHAMNPSSGSNIVKGTKNYQYIELNRMWLSDKAPRNSESMAISCSIKYIKNKYPLIKWIQSFADERCGCLGIVYQACSFDYYGEHLSTFWELDGKIYHNTVATAKKDKAGAKGYYEFKKNKDSGNINKLHFRQFRYIKFIDQRWKKKCLLEEKEYPKYYNQ